MKRIFLVFLVVAIALSSASAQAVKDAPKPVGTTRVAVVNVGYVFNKYQKATKFKHEIEGQSGGTKERGTEAPRSDRRLPSREMDNETECGQKSKDNEAKKYALTQQAKLEDLNTEIQRIVGKKQEDNLVALWKDMQDGIRVYATKNGIQLVLGYG